MFAQVKTHVQKRLAILFIKAKSWKQSKRPPTDTYKQIVIFHTIKQYSAIKRKKLLTEKYQKHYAKCKPDPEDHIKYDFFYITFAEKAKLC